MAKVRIELDNNGLKKLLQSKEVQKACQSAGDQMAKEAGPGYIATTVIGKIKKETWPRAVTEVYANTSEAFFDNLQNNTLARIAGASKKK